MSRPSADEDASRTERAAVFTLLSSALLVYALRGGTYDLVARGEAATVIWWVLLVGFALGVLPRSRPSVSGRIMILGFVLLSAWTAASFVWTESDERTSVELARTLHHLGWVILVMSVLRRSTVPAAIGGLATAGILVCGLALASRLFPSAFPVDAVQASFGGNRLNYPFNYWNAVAAWAAITASMALAISVHASRSLVRAVALASVPIAGAVVYLTYSRAGLVGVVMGSVIALALSRTRIVALIHLLTASGMTAMLILAIRRHPEIANGAGDGGGLTVLALIALSTTASAAVVIAVHRLSAEHRLRVPQGASRVLIGVALSISLVGGAALLPSVAVDAVNQFEDTGDPSVDPSDPASRLTSLSGNRINVFRAAVRAFEAEKAHGIGPGTYEFWWNRTGNNPETVRDAHSMYLEALAETGIPGFVAALLIVSAAIGAPAMKRRAAVTRPEVGVATAATVGAGLWALHSGVDWMWEATGVTMLGLACAAATCLAEPVRTTAGSRMVRAFLVVLALVAIVIQLPPLVGTSQVRSSQRAAAAGDLESARRHAQDAVDSWPWAATPLVQRALVAERSGNLAAAIVDLKRAERREPTNWKHPLLIARVRARLGRPSAALSSYRTAMRLRPLSSAFSTTREPG